MTVTQVHGTAIQAAIDAAMPGDSLSCDSVGYAGVITVPKPLTIVSDGARLNAPTVNGAINVVIASPDVTLDGFDMRGGALSVQFRGDVSRSKVVNFGSYDVDNMVRDTAGGGDDNGGNHFSFFRSIGGEVAYGTTRGGRAPSHDYGYDGGVFEVFGGSRGGRIHDVETFDAVNLTEWGRNAGDADNSDFVFSDIKVHGRRHPLYPVPVLPYPFDATKTYRRADIGAYLRALNGVVFERVEFDQLDDYAALAEVGTGFAGGIAGLAFRHCTWRLKPGVCRMIVLKGGVAPSAVSITDAIVYPNGSTELALINGGKISTPAALQSLGWTFAYFGAEPMPDPRDAQITSLQQQMQVANTAIATANGAAAAANTAADTANALLARARADRQSTATDLQRVIDYNKATL